MQQDKGVKERCVFNDIDHSYIAENQSIDLMHDVYEGVANYTITKVLNCFILVKEVITLEEVNVRIHTFSCGNLEAGTTTLTMERVKEDNVRSEKQSVRLKQASAEIMFVEIFRSNLFNLFIYQN